MRALASAGVYMKSCSSFCDDTLDSDYSMMTIRDEKSAYGVDWRSI